MQVTSIDAIRCFCTKHSTLPIVVVGRELPALLAKHLQYSLYSPSIPLSQYNGIHALFIWHYALHTWNTSTIIECLTMCFENALPCIFIEYGLAERTIEWLFGWSKFMHTMLLYPEQYSALRAFLRVGGIAGYMYSLGYTMDVHIREHRTQTVLYTGVLSK